MASRINTRLVVPLLIILVIITVGVVGAAFYSARRSATYYESRGREAAKANDWRTAESYYSKAVNRDQSNIALQDEWIDAIRHIVPGDYRESKEFLQSYFSILKQRTETRPNEVQYHLDWLKQLLESTRPVASTDDGQFLASEAQNMIDHMPAGSTDPQWQTGYLYRGLGNTAFMRNPTAVDAIRKQTLEDLQTGLKYAPDNSDAACAIVTWYEIENRRLSLKGLPKDAQTQLDDAVKFAEDFSSAHPDDFMFLRALAELRAVVQPADSGSPAPDLTQARKTMAQAETLALSQKDLAWWQAILLATTVQQLDGDVRQGAQRAAAIINKSLSTDPGDPRLLNELGTYLYRMGRVDDALATYRQIVDESNLPTSIEARQLFAIRPQAVLEQFDIYIDQWSSAVGKSGMDSKEAQAAEQHVNEMKSQYEKMSPSSDPQLLYLDGRIAAVQGHPDVTASKLNQFLNQIEGNPIRPAQHLQALLQLANALDATGQSGAAYSRLNDALQVSGGRYVNALVAMIRIDIARHSFDDAQAELGKLRSLNGDPKIIETLTQTLADARSTVTGEPTDPLEAGLAQARMQSASGHFEQSLLILKALFATDPKNPRVLLELSRAEEGAGRADDAIRYLDELEKIAPDQDIVKVFRARILKQPLGPVLESIVDRRPGLSDFDRLLAKWQLFRANNLDDEAQQFIDQARQLKPDSPMLLDYDMGKAVEANDLEAAQKIVTQAESSNADQANGLTFRGRLELAKKDYPAAIASFTQAANIKSYDGTVWRLLGIANREAGNYNAAYEAFSKAIEREPFNVQTLQQLAGLQILRHEFTAALDTVRQARRYAPNDRRINAVWEDLEGRYGHRTQIIQMRHDRLESNPEDIGNAINLAMLYDLSGQIPKGREILASLKPASEKDRLSVTKQMALLYLDEHNIPAARKEVQTFIASTPAPDRASSLEALLSLATNLENVKALDEAHDVITLAMNYQDPVKKEADREMAIVLQAQGDFAGAAGYCQSALKADPDSAILSLSLIQLDLNLAAKQAPADAQAAGQTRDKALAMLDAHEARHGQSVETMLLRASILVQQGRNDDADRLFNQTVAKYPQDHRVYLARAQNNLRMILSMNDNSRVSRLQADVDQAMKLNPTDPEPLKLLVQLAAGRKDPRTGQNSPDYDKMADYYGQILSIAPNDDQDRQMLVQLLVKARHFDQARSTVNEALAAHPDNYFWYAMLGDVEKLAGSPPSTVLPAYKKAFELQPDPVRLIKYAETLMDAGPAEVRLAADVLGSNSSLVSSSPHLQMDLARVQAMTGQFDQARTTMLACATAIRQIKDNEARGTIIRLWFQFLPRAVKAEDFIATVASAFPGADRTQEVETYLAIDLSQAAVPGNSALAAKIRADGVARLLGLRQVMTSDQGSTPGKPDPLLHDVGWNLGNSYFAMGDYAKAVDAWKWVLSAYPDDADALNNTAYLMARYLGQAEQALPLAERAWKIKTDDASTSDTYGYVLYCVGRLDDARTVLTDSVAADELPANQMHLGQVLIKQGDRAGAQQHLNRALELAMQSGQKETAEEIRKSLEEAGSPQSGG